MPDNSTLATFRIDKDKWEAFKNKSGNASKVLLSFIDSYLASESIPVNTQSINTSSVQTNIEIRIDELESRLEYLASLESKLSNIDNLEKRLEVLESLGKLAA